MSNTEHIEDLQADKSHDHGCVTKCVGSAFKKHHGSYRRNGYDEHKGNPAKEGRYAPIPERVEEFPPTLEQKLGAKKGVKQKPKLPRNGKNLWNFTGKNFVSANTPFTHMYHHMVPWEVMSETFKFNELRLFQLKKYNLNQGINLIILPCGKRIGILIGMYSHPNDHPKYTLDLIDQLTAIRDNIKGDQSKHLKKTEVGEIKSQLESWETAEWAKIAAAGLAATGVHINEYKPSGVTQAANGAVEG
jgi:hypothetical protein